MEQDSYQVNVKHDKYQYWFISSGKNGDVMKVVTMQPLLRANRYNLAVADVDNGKLDYESITDNGDLDQVFGTVSEIVKFFTENFPGSENSIKGNTAVKTRLYTMKVSNHLKEIKSEFELFGTTDASGNGIL